MRKIKEVLRLKYSHDLSVRQIARSCGISRPTVAEYLMRARAAGFRLAVTERVGRCHDRGEAFPPRSGKAERGHDARCRSHGHVPESHAPSLSLADTVARNL